MTVEGPSARVVADPALLEQALLIPIGNSIQHSDPGQTVQLRISRASVTVEDEAGGIAEEDLPHLFERFYTGKGSSGGTVPAADLQGSREKMDGGSRPLREGSGP